MPPPTHDECRKRVCLLCFAKASVKKNTFRKVNPSLQTKIEQHVIHGLDPTTDERLPNVLCPTCVRTINDFDHSNQKKRKSIPLGDHSQLYQVNTRLSSSSTFCTCLICKIAQSVPFNLANVRGADKMPPNPRGKIMNEEGEEAVIHLCRICLTEIGRGRPHVCNKTSRATNLQKMAERGSPTSKHKLASSIIKEKEREENGLSNGSICLPTSTGKPIQLTKSPPSMSQRSPLFTSEDMSAIQVDMNLSTNETLKLASHIRTASKRRSSITPHLKEELYNQNHRLDEFFTREQVRFLIKENPKTSECQWETKTLVYCKDISGLIGRIEELRGKAHDHVKLGIDGGGTFLKICLSLFDDDDNIAESKRASYSEGISAKSRKYSSVKKLFIIAITENYRKITLTVN